MIDNSRYSPDMEASNCISELTFPVITSMVCPRQCEPKSPHNDDTQFPCELFGVERQHVAARAIVDCEVDDLRRPFVVIPDRADLPNEDPVGARLAGVLEPDRFQLARLDDKCDPD